MIKVSYFDINEKKVNDQLNDTAARIFQHEYEHLKGELIIHKAKEVLKLSNLQEYNNFLNSLKKKDLN